MSDAPDRDRFLRAFGERIRGERARRGSPDPSTGLRSWSTAKIR